MLVSQYHKTVNSTVDHWDGKAKEARQSVHVIETEMIRILFFFLGSSELSIILRCRYHGALRLYRTISFPEPLVPLSCGALAKRKSWS